ncbi:MAG: ribosome assembly cofactor RimP [Rikenellaceae bacterium]
MITKELITSIIEEHISENDYFLVDIKISPQFVIDVTIDSMTGVAIDKCIELSRFIESKFDREEQDFELTVGSQSISEPFVVEAQYIKNIGREVEVLTNGGDKVKGLLSSFNDGIMTLTYTEKQVVEGKKRKVEVEVTKEINITDVKSTKLIIKI